MYYLIDDPSLDLQGGILLCQECHNN